jgi:aldose 1-epimerase
LMKLSRSQHEMRLVKTFSYILLGIFSISGCTPKNEIQAQKLLIKEESFRKELKGKKVDLFTLTNGEGITVQITNYGGKIVSIIVPDTNGNFGDVCLGYESLDQYLNGSASMGATIGPYANRIANAEFELDGKIYTLDKNNGEHTIHGGSASFRSMVWDVEKVEKNELILSILSEDGAGGFPGNLRLTVTFSVTPENELRIQYHATTDQKTVINFTNHAFFNLAGEDSGDILRHELMVNAGAITPVDEDGIPTGEFLPVEGTPFDFRKSKFIGEDISDDHIQLKNKRGYDHNFVLNNPSTRLFHAATLKDPASGRIMEVYTTEPGLQVYTANSRRNARKGGKTYGPSSVCLETQHFPDSPHHDHFPSCVLEPGREYRSTTVYQFGVEEL